MAHRSLYRVHRPQTFADVVGQEHVTRTLRNAVEEGRVAHAYLFTGPRGTGKTTTARILAKALDCEKGPTPDPDNTCESCREIAEGIHPDVHELDAASRTGVDAVRDEIITKVQYAPTRGTYKVYIIDEVHMLSTSAFNALLKTLEEPPPRTVFVLCTTHPHKVPETIHSRCQQFDFRRIGVDDIVRRLEDIARDEAIAVERGSLDLIARHAAGGMRDAIGILDQLSAFTGKSVLVADVEGLLGEVDSAQLFEMSSLLADRDVAGLFGAVQRLVESGHDVGEFVRALTGHVRDLYLERVAGAQAVTGSQTADVERLAAQAARFDADRLARMLDELGRLAGELRWAPDARLALEVALTRLARPDSDITLASLAERVAALEAGVNAAGPGPRATAAVAEPPSDAACTPPRAPAPATSAAEGPPAAAPSRSPRAAASASGAPAPPSAPPAPPAASGLDLAELRRRWPDVIRAMKEVRPATSKMFLGTEADVDGEDVVVEFAPDRKVFKRMAEEQDVTQLLRSSIERVLGWRVAVRYQLGRGTVRAGHGNHPVGAAAPAHASGGPHEGSSPSAADADALDRMLIEGLGAEMISERPADDPKGTDR